MHICKFQYGFGKKKEKFFMGTPLARGLTGLRPEGCGRLTAAGCVEGLRKKVLRIDGPFRAQGFLSLTGPLGPRVVVSPLRAMSIIMPPFGGHVHIEYHNHSYPRTSLRHFVALFP